MKECNKCHEVKPIDEFYKRPKSKDGYRNDCKSCVKEVTRQNRIKNKDKIKVYMKSYGYEYRAKNKSAISIYSSQYYKKNKKEIDIRHAKHYMENKSRINKNAKLYREKNKEQISSRMKRYKIIKKDFISDRNAIYRKANKLMLAKSQKDWLARNRHKANAVSIRRRAKRLQATTAWSNEFFIEEAYRLAHLRSKIHGFKWNVDHIIPLSSKLVCGLHCEANLQVIPAMENKSKGNRYWPDMP